MKYKNLIFDMGNVLIRFEPEFFLEREGITDNAVKEMLQREIYESPGWGGMDKGEWNEDDFERDAFCKLPEELHAVAHRLIYHWDEPIVPIEGMAEVLKKCKKAGCRLYLLSNASRRQHQYWERIPGYEYFDGKLISADVLLVKPNPDIYIHLMKKYNLRPEESLFVDDMSNNTEAARKIGMSAFDFHGNTMELERLLFP